MARKYRQEPNTLDSAGYKLHHALSAIRRYQNLANELPIHDLVSMVYADLDVKQKFSAGLNERATREMHHYLDEFLYSLLDINAGRYTSLYSICIELNSRILLDEKIAESMAMTDKNAISLLTIHQAKGLQAAIVIIVDTDKNCQRTQKTFTCCARPILPCILISFCSIRRASNRHHCIKLCSGKRNNKTRSTTSINCMWHSPESVNCSSSAPARSSEPKSTATATTSPEPADATPKSWYKLLQGLGEFTEDDEHNVGMDLRFQQPKQARRHGNQSEPTDPPATQIIWQEKPQIDDPKPSQPPKWSMLTEKRPKPDGGLHASRAYENKYQGTLFHRIMCLISEDAGSDLTLSDLDIQAKILQERTIDPFATPPNIKQLQEAIALAREINQRQDMRWIFDPKQYRQAWNELSLMIKEGPTQSANVRRSPRQHGQGTMGDRL